MAYELVVSRGVVLGVLIPKVGCYWSPKIFELPLGTYILYPIEAHVDGLGLIMIQGFVEKHWIWNCPLVFLLEVVCTPFTL